MTNAMQSEPVPNAGGPERPRTHRRSWIWASVLLLVAALALGVPYLQRRGPADDPWTTHVKAAGRTAQTTFGRTVLRDGSISADEYARANDRVVECTRAGGATISLENRYGLVIFSSTGSYQVDALNRCDTGDLATIRSLYEQHYKDPHGEGDIVYVRCLRNAGFPVTPANPAQPGSVDDLFDKLLDASGPADFPKVERCIYDPAGSPGPSA